MSLPKVVTKLEKRLGKLAHLAKALNSTRESQVPDVPDIQDGTFSDQTFASNVSGGFNPYPGNMTTSGNDEYHWLDIITKGGYDL